MNKYIKIINAEAYCDYTNNTLTHDEINKFSAIVFEKLDIVLDEIYLDFLVKINGFDLNGMNFYGTKEQSDLYIKGALEVNEFWRAELLPFDKHYIVADGDMDFYCYDPLTKEYIVFDKATCEKEDTFNSFQELMKELIKIYV